MNWLQRFYLQGRLPVNLLKLMRTQAICNAHFYPNQRSHGGYWKTTVMGVHYVAEWQPWYRHTAVQRAFLTDVILHRAWLLRRERRAKTAHDKKCFKKVFHSWFYECTIYNDDERKRKY